MPTFSRAWRARPNEVCIGAHQRRVSRASALSVTVVDMGTNEHTYPVRYSVDYPDRPLNRATTALRILAAIPIVVVLAAVSGGSWQWSRGAGQAGVAGAGGLLFFGPLVMILFRRKYPRWWFDWKPRAAAIQQSGRRVPRAHGRSLPVGYR